MLNKALLLELGTRLTTWEGIGKCRSVYTVLLTLYNDGQRAAAAAGRAAARASVRCGVLALDALLMPPMPLRCRAGCTLL